ncbi:MAG: hypothetical protein KJ706_02885 [Candidatus Omnitrophica bacterium]|nr:hypothetical protein [Candidatus Omnitrophota bacterium]
MAKLLRDKGVVPDKIICAESRNYCPEEYIAIIKEAITEAFGNRVSNDFLRALDRVGEGL